MKRFIQTCIAYINIHKTHIVVTFLLIGLLFIDPAFAQDAGSESITLQNRSKRLNELLSFLGRGRILLATLAGKLMTNEFVYGSFLHLDVFLWRTWNIMKNFANFTIGFLLLFYIIKHIFDPNGSLKDLIGKKVKAFLIAGVLIQASWFMVGALIDISTVALAAVSSFPSQFIQEDARFQKNVNEASAGIYAKKIIRRSNVKDGEIPLDVIDNEDVNYTEEELYDFIMPNYNSISGPLIFMGMSIFKFQHFLTTEELSYDSIKTFTMSMLLKFALIVLYTLALLILFVMNVIRILFLRLFIAISPFIILISILKEFGDFKTDTVDIPKRISIKSVVLMIFKPLIYVAFLSLMLIFVTGVRGVLTTNERVQIDELVIERDSNEEIVTYGEFGNTTIRGNRFYDVQDTAQSTIGDLIVFGFTIFLLWMLVKMAIKVGDTGTFLDGAIKNMSQFISKGISNVPLVPLPGGGRIGVGNIKSGLRRANDKMRTAGIDIEKGQFDLGGKANLEKNLNNMLGIEGTSRAPENTQDLEQAIKNDRQLKDFFTKTKDIADNLTTGVYINHPQRSSLLLQALEKIDKTNAPMKTIKDGGNTRTLRLPPGYENGKTTNEKLQTIFSDTGNVKRLHAAMKNAGIASTKAPTSRNTLKTTKYGKLATKK